jgi:hypothetical protein
MKKIMMIVSLLVTSSAVQSSEIDNLVNTSGAIVSQIDRGVMLTGAALQYANTGEGLSNGGLSSTAHISTEQLDAYNNALSGMSMYTPYGSVQVELENLATQELELMDQAVDTFAEVVVGMLTVVEVSEMASEASTPDQEAAVQDFVVSNAEVLTLGTEEVDTYNQSLDDIETHANNASAYLAVAGNEDAVAFLDQKVQDANTTADQTNIFYDANAQWLAMGTPMQRNLNIIGLSGENTYGFDLYVSEADVLAIGSASEFYLTGPTAVGYKCFMTQEDCE